MRSLDDLTMYRYGLLEDRQAEEIRTHLDSCPECREQVERITCERRLFDGSFSRGDADLSGRAEIIEGVLARRPTALTAVPIPERAPREDRKPTPRVIAFLRIATGIAAGVCIAILLFGSRKPNAAPGLSKPATPVAASAEPAPRRELLAYVQEATVGFLAAQDEEGRPVGELSLKSHHVVVEILDGIAKTTVEEDFQNHTDRRLEGTFHFPLPPDASISRLALEVNGKMEEGTCLERERAREVFESIVRKMKDPALLEWMPGGIFKCRIFPIEPRATKRVVIAYTQALPCFRGRMSYVYPLVSEKTKAHPPEELRIDVLARFSGRLRAMESPSHAVDVHRRNDKEGTLTFSSRNTRPKNDFVVTLATEDEELRVIPHKTDGEDGYFALILSPEGAPARRPDRYVFILDVSASVTAPELEVEKRLVRAMMENRIPGDRFEILASNIDALSSGEVDLRAANDFMDRLRPMGGSDLLSAFRAAPEGEIVYIGKGAPTYGETDPAKILAAVKGRRIRTIGVGSRANVDFLQKLGGHFRVNPNDNIPKRIQEIAATLGSPILSEIKVDGGDAVYDVTGVRDLFFGERLVVIGRYRGPTAKLVVTGRGFRREVAVALPSKEEGNNYVRRLWAQRKIADLLAQGESKKAEVTDLGIKNQIMTPYTSFLVLENEQMWKDHQLKREVQNQDRLLGKGVPLPSGLGQEKPRESPQTIDLPRAVPQQGSAPGFTRFSLVSNGASQSIDLPRLPEGSLQSTPYIPLSRGEVLTTAEVRTTTNQFGGLEFSLGEATRAFVKAPAVYEENGIPVLSDIPLINYLFDTTGKDGRPNPSESLAPITKETIPGAAGRKGPDPDEYLRNLDTSVFRLKYIQPPTTYTAKVEPGKIINGQPLQPAVDMEDLLRRFELLRKVRSVLTKDTDGRVLGLVEFDPASNCLVVRDTKAVQARVAEIVASFDVEPGQVIIDFKVISTTNLDLLKLGIQGDATPQDGANSANPPAPAVPAQGTRLPFGNDHDSARRGNERFLSQYDLTMILRAFKQDKHSRMIQEPTMAVVDNTEATIFIGETISYAELRPTTNQFGESKLSLSEADKPVKIGFGLTVIPRIVPDSEKVILTIVPLEDVRSGQSGGASSPGSEPKGASSGAAQSIDLPQVSSTVLVTKLIIESGRTAVLGGLVADRFVLKDPRQPKPGDETASKEHLLIFVTPRIVKSGAGASDALKNLLKMREEEEKRELLQQQKGKPEAVKPLGVQKPDPRANSPFSVLSANGTSNEVSLNVGSRGGAVAGQLFTITRDRQFVGIVRILEASDDRARGEVWQGLAVGRILPGDAAEQVWNVQGYLAELPPEVRAELASRANVGTIRAKMALRE